MTCKIFLYPMTQCVLSSFSCCLRALQSTLEVKAKFLSLSLVITSLQGAVVQIAHTYFSSRKIFPRKKKFFFCRKQNLNTLFRKKNELCTIQIVFKMVPIVQQQNSNQHPPKWSPAPQNNSRFVILVSICLIIKGPRKKSFKNKKNKTKIQHNYLMKKTLFSVKRRCKQNRYT